MKRKIIVLLGTPGAGKGTQADLFADKVNLSKISVGNLLREEIAEKTKIGKIIKETILGGELIDSKLTEKVLRKRLLKDDVKKGFIVDGYPRKEDQIKYLMNDFSRKDDNLIVIFIGLSDKEIKIRLTGRRNCPVCGEKYHLKYKKPKKRGICDSCGAKLTQREDDNPKAVTFRIKQFHKENAPIEEYFDNLGILFRINGEQTIQKIHKDIMKILKKKKAL